MEDQNQSKTSSGSSDKQHVFPFEEKSTSRLSNGSPPKPFRLRSDGVRFVEKNSLTEQGLLDDQIRTSNGSDKNESLTEEEKWQQRRASNRLAAFKCRQRRKIIIEDLQESVARLTRHNAESQQQIHILQDHVKKLYEENALLRTELVGIDKVHSDFMASLVHCQPNMSTSLEVITLLAELVVIKRYLALMKAKVAPSQSSFDGYDQEETR